MFLWEHLQNHLEQVLFIFHFYFLLLVAGGYIEGNTVGSTLRNPVIAISTSNGKFWIPGNIYGIKIQVYIAVPINPNLDK